MADRSGGSVGACLAARPVGSLEWAPVAASGTAPSARRDMALGYLQTQNKLVVFGGRGGPITDDTWEFNLGTGEIYDASLMLETRLLSLRKNRYLSHSHRPEESIQTLGKILVNVNVI